MMALSIRDPDTSDREELDRLLAATAQGDREAFGEMYQRTRGAVYAMTLGILKRSHDAQDAAQDTFVRIWEAAGSYRSKGSPMAWILTIARNTARMRLRQAARTEDLSEEEWDAIPAPAPDVTPEDRAVLQDALSVLREEDRQIVMLHASSGLKHREIAQLLEMPIATVLSRYHRAIKQMRAHMGGGGYR